MAGRTHSKYDAISVMDWICLSNRANSSCRTELWSPWLLVASSIWAKMPFEIWTRPLIFWRIRDGHKSFEEETANEAKLTNNF